MCVWSKKYKKTAAEGVPNAAVWCYSVVDMKQKNSNSFYTNSAVITSGFGRVKRDYMGNDQLLPAYNIQMAVCDEYIAQYAAYPYASDMDCFQPLMEAFHSRYGFYPQYPVADAGYGSFNNYLYCQEKGMENI